MPLGRHNVAALVGSDVTGFRSGVRTVLTGIDWSAHLNDLLRGLSEAPELVTRIGA